MRCACAALMLTVIGHTPGAAAQIIPRSVLPGVGPGATRAAVNVDEAPWRGVVRVQTEIGARCTGALIGPTTVLTAAHCLYGHGTGHLVQPSAIHVLTGYSHGDYAGHARAVSFIVGLGFALGPNMRPTPNSSPAGDWAVLSLDARLGTADRVLALLHQVPPAGTPAMLGGYEQDRAQVIVADLGCAVTGSVEDAVGRLMLRHSCAATRGVSGAPLLVRTPDGAWGVAGVASLAGQGTSGGFAVPAAAVGPSLQRPPR